MARQGGEFDWYELVEFALEQDTSNLSDTFKSETLAARTQKNILQSQDPVTKHYKP